MKRRIYTNQNSNKFLRTYKSIPDETILNADIYYKVLSHFDDVELLKFRSISTQWKDIIDQHIFLQRHKEIVLNTPSTTPLFYFFTKKIFANAASKIFSLLTKTQKNWHSLHFTDFSMRTFEHCVSAGFFAIYGKVINILKTFTSSEVLYLLKYMQKNGYNLKTKGQFDQTFLHMFSYTNDLPILEFLINAGLKADEKDSISKLPAIAWRILGLIDMKDISISVEIFQVLINAETDVKPIFFSDDDVMDSEPENASYCNPLLVLREKFESLKTPDEKDKHLKCIALLANNYQGTFDDLIFPLSNFNYTESEIECIRKYVQQFRTEQIQQSITHKPA